MSEISVRVLTEDDWQLYRTFRLAALKESPDAFAATHDDEASFPETAWQERMQRATRLLAERDDEYVGVASVRRLGPAEDDDRDFAEFFGMWVDPAKRGGGIGVQLMRAGVSIARSMGCDQLVYWVSTDNGAAVAFASSYGFRTTDSRRLMAAQGQTPDADADEEMMMILPLADDPGRVASSTIDD